MEHYSKTIPNTSKKTSGWHLSFWIVVFAVAYIARDLMPIRVPDIIFTGICAAAFVLLDLEGALGLYLFTSVLTVPDFEIRIVYICVMIAKTLLRGKKLNVTMLLSVLFLVLLELVNLMIFSRKGIYDLFWSFGCTMSYILMPVFWINRDFSSRGYERAMLCYVVGCLLGGIVLLVVTANMVGWDVLLESEELRLGLLETTSNTGSGAMTTTYNANQLGVMQAISASLVIVLMYKKALPKLLGILLLLLMSVIILFTKSRTGTLLYLLPLVIYFWFVVVKRKQIWQGLAVVAAIFLLFLFIQRYFPQMVQGLWNRFTKEDDITNGRAGLNAAYLKIWTSDVWCFLFGYGLGSYLDVVDIGTSPHNGLVDILISWGIAGFAALCVQWVVLFRYSVKKIPKRTYLIAFLPVIIAVVESVGGQYLTVGYPHMRLCFLLLAAYSFATEQQEK